MWALFCNDQQISRPFEAERDVWQYARRSSLIADRRLLERYEIRELTAAILPKRSSRPPRPTAAS